jgi:hypothetical protein
VLPILDGLFERVVIGLPGACFSLDDAAAEEIVQGIGGVEQSVALLDRARMQGEWRTLLRDLIVREAVHPLVRGWCCRLLLEAGSLDPPELQRLARLALAHGNEPGQAAAWIEGLLRGSGRALLYHDGVWSALDSWLRTLNDETFVTTLPVLRRGFSGFQPAERRQMSDKVKRLSGVADATPEISADALVLNRDRARLVIPVLMEILGGSSHGDRRD